MGADFTEIQKELVRLSRAKTAIVSAITAKGVTVPSTTKLDGMAALIESIPTGGWPDTITPGDMPVLVSAKQVVNKGMAIGTYDTGVSLTIPKAGTYRIKYSFVGERNGSNNKAQLRVNGTTKHTTTITGTSQMTGIADLALAAGDVLKMYFTGNFSTTGFFAGPIIACIAFDGYEDFIS